MKTLKEELREYAKTLKGADVYFRESWGCDYFDLLGKCFGMLTEERITLKGNLDQNIILREMYSDIEPGYYMNKKHWNTIPLDTDQISKEKLFEMIYISYKLVYQNLSKKDKEVVGELAGIE